MERGLRVAVVAGSVALALMGAAIRLWPPAQAAIGVWGWAFLAVGLLICGVAIAEWVVASGNQRKRDRLAQNRHDELLAKNADLQRELTYAAGIQQGGLAAIGHLVTTSFERLAQQRAITGDEGLRQAITSLQGQVTEVAKLVTGPKLQIVKPSEGGKVSFRDRIHGTVWPPGTPVQLLVFAGGKWHPGWDHKVEGSTWSAMCQFGDDRSRSQRSEYQLVAISGARLEV